jgi:hypothetical protein
MRSKHRTTILLGGTIAFCFSLTAPAPAETLPEGSGWGARVMMQPVMMAHGGLTALCNPRAARLASWGVDQIEKLLKPTEPQRASLNRLREAATKAAELDSAACPRAIPQNSGERLAFMAQRLAVLWERTKLIATAFEAFYSSLTEEQKAQLDRGPRRWRWRSN